MSHEHSWNIPDNLLRLSYGPRAEKVPGYALKKFSEKRSAEIPVPDFTDPRVFKEVSQCAWGRRRLSGKFPEGFPPESFPQRNIPALFTGSGGLVIHQAGVSRASPNLVRHQPGVSCDQGKLVGHQSGVSPVPGELVRHQPGASRD